MNMFLVEERFTYCSVEIPVAATMAGGEIVWCQKMCETKACWLTVGWVTVNLDLYTAKCMPGVCL